MDSYRIFRKTNKDYSRNSFILIGTQRPLCMVESSINMLGIIYVLVMNPKILIIKLGREE